MSNSGKPKSIGKSVLTGLAVMIVLFMVTISVNIQSLKSIGGNTYQLSQVYLNMQMTEGNIGIAFQQVQLYANLAYYKHDTQESETMVKKLQTAIDSLTADADLMQKYVSQTENTQLISSYATWDKTISDYAAFATKIYDAATVNDMDTALKLVNQNLDYKTPVQNAEDGYDKILTTVLSDVAFRSMSRIQFSTRTDYAMFAIFIVITIFVIKTVITKVALPASRSGKKFKILLLRFRIMKAI